MDEASRTVPRPGVFTRLESSMVHATWTVKVWLTFVRLRLRPPRFRLLGAVYPIYVGWYNKTWRNERQIELPPAMELVRQFDPVQILEVGNVLSNYQRVAHVVVDKYEDQTWTIREDIVDYRPGHSFGLIISISTLEHVGWDEAERDPSKFSRSLHHLVELLVPGGQLWATVPLGYNPFADAFLANPEPGFEVNCMERMSARPGDWMEVASASSESSPYLVHVPTAAAIAFVRYTKPGRLPART